MSSLVVLTVQRVRKGSFVVQRLAGRFWFAVTGICNGLSALTLFAAVRNGRSRWWRRWLRSIRWSPCC
jgi:hypothetical protein